MERRHFWQNPWIQLFVALVAFKVIVKPTEAMQQQTFWQNLLVSSMSSGCILFVIHAIIHSRRKNKLAKQKVLQERDEKWRQIKEKQAYLKKQRRGSDPVTTCRGCGAPMPINEAKCPYCGLANPHYSKY